MSLVYLLMNLGDYLNPERIVLLEGRSKDAAFGELVDAACRKRSDLDKKSVLDPIRKREETVSTWFVSGVAVPHGRLAGLGRLILQIALDIPREGREGRPVGTIFIIGDYEAVSKSCRQLVMNPFHGYSDDERSIINPFLEETIVVAGQPQLRSLPQ